MKFNDFRQTPIYDMLRKPMKVSAAIYFMDKGKGVAESRLELELRDDLDTEEIRSTLNCLEVLDEVDYEFDEPELEIERLYRLTPGAYEGMHSLISLLKEAIDR